MTREKRVLSAMVAPFQAFFRLEAAGGLAVMASAILAFVWANSPLRGLYDTIFHSSIEMKLAGRDIAWSVHDFTNDALMTLFFAVVGLEIKRELTSGELRSWGRAALPLLAALGGMVVPALIYLAWNPGGAGRAGWGIPVATDIAFALGCLSLVKRRVPPSLFVFLTALAIFDDLGAIVVIAVFYGQGIDPYFAALAGVLSTALFLLGRARVQSIWSYAALGLALWAALLSSGLHPTLAGVVVGLSLPVESPVERAIHRLHGLVVFGVVPLFALANAGVTLTPAAGLGSTVTLGALTGLAVGKPIGIGVATWAAIKFRLAPKPTGAGWLQIMAVACVAGVGFTMSLLVGNLAFGETRQLEDHAKIGVLLGSAVSALLGIGLLLSWSPALPRQRDEADLPST